MANYSLTIHVVGSSDANPDSGPVVPSDLLRSA